MEVSDREVLAVAESVMKTTTSPVVAEVMAGVVRYLNAKSAEAREKAKATAAERAERIFDIGLRFALFGAFVWAAARLLSALRAFGV